MYMKFNHFCFHSYVLCPHTSILHMFIIQTIDMCTARSAHLLHIYILYNYVLLTSLTIINLTTCCSYDNHNYIYEHTYIVQIVGVIILLSVTLL